MTQHAGWVRSQFTVQRGKETSARGQTKKLPTFTVHLLPSPQVSIIYRFVNTASPTICDANCHARGQFFPRHIRGVARHAHAWPETMACHSLDCSRLFLSSGDISGGIPRLSARYAAPCWWLPFSSHARNREMFHHSHSRASPVPGVKQHGRVCGQAVVEKRYQVRYHSGIKNLMGVAYAH